MEKAVLCAASYHFYFLSFYFPDLKVISPVCVKETSGGQIYSLLHVKE